MVDQLSEITDWCLQGHVSLKWHTNKTSNGQNNCIQSEADLRYEDLFNYFLQWCVSVGWIFCLRLTQTRVPWNIECIEKGFKMRKTRQAGENCCFDFVFSLHIVAPFFGLSEYRFCSSQSCPGPLSWHGFFVHLYNTCTVPRMWLEMTMCEASETVHQLCFVDSTRLVGLAWFSQCSARHLLGIWVHCTRGNQTVIGSPKSLPRFGKPLSSVLKGAASTLAAWSINPSWATQGCMATMGTNCTQQYANMQPSQALYLWIRSHIDPVGNRPQQYIQ